jgi:L-arabinose isomerase
MLLLSLPGIFGDEQIIFVQFCKRIWPVTTLKWPGLKSYFKQKVRFSQLKATWITAGYAHHEKSMSRRVYKPG